MPLRAALRDPGPGAPLRRAPPGVRAGRPRPDAAPRPGTPAEPRAARGRGARASWRSSGFAVVGLVRGDEGWRDESVVRGEPSGALYAVAHGPDRLVPALNLASARLLAGGRRATPRWAGRRCRSATTPSPRRPAPRRRASPARPRCCPTRAPPPPTPGRSATARRSTPRCPTPPPTPTVTTVALGGVPAPGRPLAADEALLLRGSDGFWLVTEGRRARIDPSLGSVVRGLELTGARPRTRGPALLGALPEAPPLVPVQVPGSGGTPTDARTAALGVPVGAVVSPDGGRFFLVAATGVQEVPAVDRPARPLRQPRPGRRPRDRRRPGGPARRRPAGRGRRRRAPTRRRPRGWSPTTRPPPPACAPRPPARPPCSPRPRSPGRSSPPRWSGPPLDGAWVAGGGAYVVPVAPGAPRPAGRSCRRGARRPRAGGCSPSRTPRAPPPWVSARPARPPVRCSTFSRAARPSTPSPRSRRAERPRGARCAWPTGSHGCRTCPPGHTTLRKSKRRSEVGRALDAVATQPARRISAAAPARRRRRAGPPRGRRRRRGRGGTARGTPRARRRRRGSAGPAPPTPRRRCPRAGRAR